MKKIIPFLLAGILLAQFASSQTELQNNIPGAKFYFSNKPFSSSNADSKTNFTSSDFIYGRLEFDKKTLMEAFGLPKDGETTMNNKNDTYLHYKVTVFKDGEQRGQPNFWEYLYVWAGEKNKNYFNFDIMPEPEKAKSMMCGTEEFRSGLASGPLYTIISQDRFPENGTYTIRVKMFQESLNSWGKTDVEEKWPVAEQDFTFNFDGKDVAKLKTNATKADELVMDNAYHLDKMPEWFYNAGNINDPKVTNAKIAAILKRDIPTKSIIKFVVAPFTGGPIWQVQKDEYGLIMRRNFMPLVNIAYKRDGKCYVGTVQLREPYEGYGNYGTLKVGTESSSSRPDYWLDCSLIK